MQIYTDYIRVALQDFTVTYEIFYSVFLLVLFNAI